MEIFEGISNAPAYFVPRSPYDRKIVYDAINRFGSRLTMDIKQHFRKTNFEHSSNLYDMDREELIEKELKHKEDNYRRYIKLLNNFIDKSSLRLNPGEKKLIYTSFNFDLSLEAGYATEYKGRKINIQSNDASWR